jgi:hypothetical protein
VGHVQVGAQQNGAAGSRKCNDSLLFGGIADIDSDIPNVRLWHKADIKTLDPCPLAVKLLAGAADCGEYPELLHDSGVGPHTRRGTYRA